MPDTQVSAPDTYGVCMPPEGKSLADVTWSMGMIDGSNDNISRDGLNALSKVITCTETSDSGSNSGENAGPATKLVIAAQPHSYPVGVVRPQRLFAIQEDTSGVTVRAAYDITFIKPEYENVLPAYPEPYLKLSPACDSSIAIPFFKGWTGRIGSMNLRRYPGPDGRMWSHWDIVLLGSAEGGSKAKALWFTIEKAP